MKAWNLTHFKAITRNYVANEKKGVRARSMKKPSGISLNIFISQKRKKKRYIFPKTETWHGFKQSLEAIFLLKNKKQEETGNTQVKQCLIVTGKTKRKFLEMKHPKYRTGIQFLR